MAVAGVLARAGAPYGPTGLSLNPGAGGGLW